MVSAKVTRTSSSCNHVSPTHTLHANVRNTALEPLECEIHHGNTNAIISQINSAYPKVEWCPPGAREFPVLS